MAKKMKTKAKSAIPTKQQREAADLKEIRANNARCTAIVERVDAIDAEISGLKTEYAECCEQIETQRLRQARLTLKEQKLCSERGALDRERRKLCTGE